VEGWCEMAARLGVSHLGARRFTKRWEVLNLRRTTGRSDDTAVLSWQSREPPVILNQLNPVFIEYCLKGCHEV
jgi:hypothetical protein